MAKLKIIKLALKTWKHNSDVDGDFILTKFYAKQEDNEFLIVERYGAKRRKYKISEIEVYDIGGGAETFTTFEDLFLRLEALNYTAFYQEGEVIFDPSIYDLADFKNESANPFVKITQLNDGLATKFNIPTGTPNRLAKFSTANTIGDSQIFDNGTNVGIGTTAPIAKLNIQNGEMVVGPSSNNIKIGFNPSNFNEISGKLNGLWLTTNNSANTSNGRIRIEPQSNSSIQYITNGTGIHEFFVGLSERMRLNNNGNLGIGTTAPAGVLDVTSTTRASLPFPRMTQTQRLAISTPAVGSIVYQTDGTDGLYIFKATVGWTFII